MSCDDLGAAALHAVHAWGAPSAPLRPIHVRENAVFDVRLTDGRRAALRLHRPGYQTQAAIEAELTWTEALADAGFPCPRPLRSLTGGLTGEPGFGRVASMVTWIEAAPVGPVPGADANAAREVLQRVGGLLAGLHDLTDGLDLPDLERPSWDAAGLVGEAPLWGRFWENQTLSRPESVRLERVRDAVRGRLADRSAADIGLVHADVLRENVLDNGQRLWLIDFDDCGYGDRLYDLGSALVQYWDWPEFPTLMQALCDGYAARRDLPVGYFDDLPMFVMLRALASCGWAMTRAAGDDARQRSYAGRALRLAEVWSRGAYTTTASGCCSVTPKTRL